jgi:peptide/nickel transport system substrate-binding protein
VRRVLAALALLAALARPAAAKDDLVIGLTQFPSTFNPMIDAMLAKSYILDMALRPLVAYDQHWQLVCMLCTELPTLANGRAKIEQLPDGKQGMAITFTLQPHAKWGDGAPVTSDDVVFAWEVGRNPKTGVPEADPYLHVTRIDVIDQKTFTLHADEVRFDYDAYFAFQPLPAHLDRKNFADPAAYARRSAYDTDTTNPGLYVGPYRIAEVSPGSHIVLVPNAAWYGTAPYFKRIVVRVVENTAALEANLLSGGIDYIPGELGLSVDQALAFQKRYGDKYGVIYKAGLAYEHIDVNLDNPILADKRVRQALLYAIDRETLSRELFAGKQPVARSFVSPLDWIYDPNLPGYPYDPARAAALLDAAGWSDMKDGVRINKAGQPLRLELMSTAGDRTREMVELVLQSYWRKVGIDVRIRNQPARVFVGDTLRKRRFSGLAMVAWIDSPENVPRSILDSREIPTAANNYAGQNDTGFRDPEVDSLLDRIEVELDRDKRRALWWRLQEIYMDELPVLPLYFRAESYVIPKWLTGIEPTGTSDSSTLWVENWRPK